VGLLDILRGERRPRRADLDRLFAMSTAEPTLTLNLGLAPSHRAGVCFKPVQMGRFEELVRDLDQLLELSGRSTGTSVRRLQDELGFTWVVLQDEDFEDLVTTVHLVNQTIEERGFSEQLLCSVFGFGADDGPVYLVYAFKRGTFYPFVPRGDRRRDNAAELRLQAALSRELPMEPELERWYPVWGVPLEGDAA
jgi:hypothetical protein